MRLLQSLLGPGSQSGSLPACLACDQTRSQTIGSGGGPDHLAVIAALLSELRLSRVRAEPVIARLGLTKKKPRGAAAVGRFAGDKQGTLELRS